MALLLPPIWPRPADVLVLERKPHFGGGVSTRELIAPGFRHDEHSNVHIMLQGNPMVTEDELGLFGKFDLNILLFAGCPPRPCSSIGTSVKLYRDLDRTCQEIAAFSPRDADAYRRSSAFRGHSADVHVRPLMRRRSRWAPSSR